MIVIWIFEYVVGGIIAIALSARLRFQEETIDLPFLCTRVRRVYRD